MMSTGSPFLSVAMLAGRTLHEVRRSRQPRET
jgi:hypothetical protein